MTATEKTPKEKSQTLQSELIETLSKKVGFNRKQLVDFAVREWVADHLTLLSPSEKKRFQSVLL